VLKYTWTEDIINETLEQVLSITSTSRLESVELFIGGRARGK
jgi:hypothetical protein